MEAASAIENFSLTMNRQLNASQQQVYSAWTDKEAITSWFSPSDEIATIVHELDLRVGGLYRIEMLEPNGNSHKIHGEYVVLNPYQQIVFTWEWESEEQTVNSLVTIDLEEQDGKTNLVLTHDKLASQESVELHSEGWVACLAQLEIFFG